MPKSGARMRSVGPVSLMRNRGWTLPPLRAWGLFLSLTLGLSGCDPSLISPPAPGAAAEAGSPSESPDASASPTFVTGEPEARGTPGPGLRESPLPRISPGKQPVPLASSSALLIPLGPLSTVGPGVILPAMDERVALSLDFGVAGAPMKGRRYQLYAGASENFAFRLEFSRPLGPGDANRVRVLSGSGTELTSLRDSGTVYVPAGNVAILELHWDGQGELPDVRIEALGQRPGSGRLPAEATALADRVASMPVSLNQGIEVFSRYENGAEVQFLTVSGVRGKKLDLIADGPATVYVNDPASGFYFPSTTDSPWERIDAASGRMLHLPASEHDTLLLTVRFEHETRQVKHLRLSVNEVRDAFELRVRFPGNVSDYGQSNSQALATKMAEIARHASLLLYQATGGRSRIDRLRVLVGLNADAGASIQMRVDPFTYPTDLLREHVQLAFTPLALIEVDLPWWQRELPKTLPGPVLAHELFHQRYELADEYAEKYPLDDPDNLVSGTNLCPISIMGDSNRFELCWSGNHNPGGSQTLRDRSDDPRTLLVKENLSMWDIYARKVGIPAPDRHPSKVLMDVTGDPWSFLTEVNLPLEVKVDTGAGTISLPPLPNLPSLPRLP